MKDEKDMIRIKNKFYILYEYFGKKYGDESALDPFKNIIDNAFEKKELRKLKSIDKELNTWIREMPRTKEEKLEIKQIIKQRLNEDFNDIEKKRLEKISIIIKSCKIRNKSEYRLLSERIEEIYDDRSKKDEMEKIDKLLAGFHK